MPDALNSHVDIQNTGGKPLKFSSDKLIGYVLLSLGLLMIFAALFMIYQILTGKSKPPKVFDVVAPSIKLPTESSNVGSEFKIIPDEVFNGVLNIGMYYLLMMFLASSGAKIAGIGVKMIKDIKVQIKEEKQSLR